MLELNCQNKRHNNLLSGPAQCQWFFFLKYWAEHPCSRRIFTILYLHEVFFNIRIIYFNFLRFLSSNAFFKEKMCPDTPFLWYRGFYDTTVFILSVPMHCSATYRFFYLYIHKHNSHIYRIVWPFCPNVLNFCKYTYFYLFLRNSGHFYFTLIPCFVKCPIIKP